MIRAMFQCTIVDDRTLEAEARIEVVSTGKGGGFRVIQTQNQHTDAIDWQEIDSEDFDDKGMSLALHDLAFETIRFKTQADYDHFKELMEEN